MQAHRARGTWMLSLLLAACGGATTVAPVDDAGNALDASAAADASDAGASSDAPPNGCTLTASTTPGAVVGRCTMRTRDASACAAERKAAGLTGFWLAFSCRVSLKVANDTVTIATDSRPDYPSVYFPTSDACYAPEPASQPNPNTLSPQSISAVVPLHPTSAAATPMQGGTVGVAVNGVALFDNQAAPGDDIYGETATFDACQGHPTPTRVYHYHTEPTSISSADAAFIGVMRDGYPLYGRLDQGGATPSLDAAGGHTGPTPDSATPIYHYHVNQRTSTNPRSAGQAAWFLTTGTYHGAPGSCTGCQ